MAKCIVFGEFESDNLGDVLLGEGQKYIYGLHGVDVYLSTFSKNSSEKTTSNNDVGVSFFKYIHRRFYSKYYIYRHFLESVVFLLKRKSKFKSMRGKVCGYDKVIIGGGQLFSDNSLRMLLDIYTLTVVCKEDGLDIKIIGSGAPFPKTFISRFIMRKILSYYSCDSVFLRDYKSVLVFNSLSEIKLNHNNIIPDFAIPYINSIDKKPYNKDEKKIGLAPISFNCLTANQKESPLNKNDWWVSLAKYLISKEYKPVLFCHGTFTDYERCLQVQTCAKDKGVIIDVLPRPEDIQSYFLMVNSFSNIVCQRLHISITAFSLDKSPISLPWDDKVKYFYKEAGLNNNFIENEKITYSEIYKILTTKKNLISEKNQLISKTNSIIIKIFGK